MKADKPLSVESFLKDIENVLVFPEVGLTVSRMAQDPRSSALEIANEIGKDPIIAAQVLRLANSAYYQFPSIVDSIPRAIAIIGMKDLCNLVLMVSLINAMNKVTGEEQKTDYIWQHSLFVGLLAKELSKHTLVQILNKDRMFVIGVLHEVGRILLSMKLPDIFESLISQGQDSEQSLYRLEKQALGFAHHDVTVTLLSNWNFPKSIIETIRNQYHPQKTDEFHLESSMLLLANCYSEETGLGSAGLDTEQHSVEIAEMSCGLTEEKITQSIEDARKKYFSLLPTFMVSQNSSRSAKATV